MTFRNFSYFLPLAIAISGGCSNGPEYVTLFDENGAWSLVAYNTEGTYLPNDASERRDKFLLYFDRTSEDGTRPGGRIAAATCIDMMGDQSLDSSTCDDGFTCRCFDYTFENDTMLFKEYAPTGSQLYVPKEGEPTPGEVVTIFLSEVEGSTNTFNFTPLPYMLFESDQMDSQYHFQRRAAPIFDGGCYEFCFETNK